MIQQDIVEQRFHHDAVSFGGWSLDLHPADGVFSEVDGCTQWHSKGNFFKGLRSHMGLTYLQVFIKYRFPL